MSKYLQLLSSNYFQDFVKKKNMLKNYTVNIPATYSHMRVLRIGASCINPVILISCSYTLKLLGIQIYSLAVVIHSNSQEYRHTHQLLLYTQTSKEYRYTHQLQLYTQTPRNTDILISCSYTLNLLRIHIYSFAVVIHSNSQEYAIKGNVGLIK